MSYVILDWGVTPDRTVRPNRYIVQRVNPGETGIDVAEIFLAGLVPGEYPTRAEAVREAKLLDQMSEVQDS